MISVCILTKNAAATLRDTLESIKAFPEVLILDTGSTDETLHIAAQYPNAAIYKAPFTGFGPLRNQASQLAKYDWILALDSDEILSPHLQKEIQELPLNPFHSYAMRRHNFYNGKRIKGSGWSPDIVARLYHRKSAQFSPAAVHESLIAETKQLLKAPILHTPYRSTAEFLAKMQHYSTLFAEQYKGKKKSSFLKALTHGVFSFLRNYFIKRGILDGSEGFIISLYNANTTFYKYLKLAEANNKISEKNFSK